MVSFAEQGVVCSEEHQRAKRWRNSGGLHLIRIDCVEEVWCTSSRGAVGGKEGGGREGAVTDTETRQNGCKPQVTLRHTTYKRPVLEPMPIKSGREKEEKEKNVKEQSCACIVWHRCDDPIIHAVQGKEHS